MELLHRRRRIKRKSGRLIEFPSVRVKQEEEEEEEKKKKKKKKKKKGLGDRSPCVSLKIL